METQHVSDTVGGSTKVLNFINMVLMINDSSKESQHIGKIVTQEFILIT